jgi:thiopeptide-type bacteriocin biosynthesis protein
MTPRFFVLRTALLPVDELTAWGEGLAAPAAARAGSGLEEALAADRVRLRATLAAALERPEVREAVFVASPDLWDGLESWRRDPEGKKGQRAEKSLARYFARMAGRSTPFGLFSGCTVGGIGGIGETSRLTLAGSATYRRSSRLDNDYLFALALDLERDPVLRGALLFRPNSSLYRAAGRLRYAEGRLVKRRRDYALVAVEPTPYLEATLERAAGGARRGDLAASLFADLAGDSDGGITLAEAEEYVDSLIDTQILVSDLTPLITGAEPLDDLIERLREAMPQASQASEASPLLARLEAVRSGLAALDAGGLGRSPDAYRAIAGELAALPARVELPRLFQVDMVKPAGEPVLGAEVTAELLRGIELLRRLIPEEEDEGLKRFLAAFRERYGEGREVPLAEALDDEVGIGFERLDDASSEPSPLLAGLRIPGEPRDPEVSWGARHEILLDQVQKAVRDGALEIELDAETLQAMSYRKPSPIPASLLVMASLAARSPEALARGEFDLFFINASGPSSGRLLGRFCHADPALARALEPELRAEEALDPGALYAEVVHLPDGRLGNVLCRPVLRGYEIPYLGRSGAPPERQIPLSDLLVSVRGARIELRSRRLGKRIVPRMTTAHNFGRSSLRVYRFLCRLQNPRGASYLIWSWGALRSATFLPRVRSGRLVLARARWVLSRKEVEALAKLAGAERFRAVQRLREERRLPRWVVLVEADNELPVDLDNALAIDSFVDASRSHAQTVLMEMFPAPEELAVTGPEGRFVHDLLVPFLLPAEAEDAPAPELRAVASLVQDLPAAARSFPPGSEWLYAKLYTGTATADGLLRDVVTPLCEWALGTGVADRWFFLRYGDPDWHLRLRFHGDPERLMGELLPRLTAAAVAGLEDGRLIRLQLDTYDREVERYGGPEGIEIAERIFQADSQSVLNLLELLDADAGEEARWRLALAGVDRLLTDLGLDLPARAALATLLRDKSDFQHALGERFRREKASLEPLLDLSKDEDGELAPGLAVLRRRSRDLAPAVADLHALAARGGLTQTVERLAMSFIHMHVNRLIRAGASEHERVLYDFLARLYDSRIIRGVRGVRELGGSPVPEPVPAHAGR